MTEAPDWIKIPALIHKRWFFYPMSVERPSVSSEKLAQAEATFRRQGGLLRTSEAIQSGIHPRTLYALRDTGRVEQLSRGLYRLKDMPPLSEPDLVTVARRIPEGVICLISALAWHDLTTQIPHSVHLALPRGFEPPRLAHPPLQVFWFTGNAFSAGIEIHVVDRTEIRVYSPEKTIADCFKYRNKLGVNVALEALRRYRSSRRRKLGELLRFARVCRVEKVMMPYLEAIFESG